MGREFLGDDNYGNAYTSARIEDQIVVGAFFIELNLKGKTQGGDIFTTAYRFTSSPVDIVTYAGDYPNETSVTWTGGDDLLEIGTITEATSLQANGCVVKMDGINNSVVGVALNSSIYSGSNVKIMYAPYQIKVQGNITENTTTVITDDNGRPPIFFEGLLDTMLVTETGETATVTLNIESPLSIFERAKPNRYTFENQKGRSTAAYISNAITTDFALAHVVDVQRKVLKWGT